MAKKYIILNQKGGVAKTTTSESLAHHFSKMGYRVLMVDLDPQANLTTGTGVKNQDSLKHTVSELLVNTVYGNEIDPKQYTIPVRENLDLIPANIKLANIEVALIEENDKEKLLKKALKGFEEDYDIIIVDCSPSLGNLTINALTFGNRVLIPTAPEVYSGKGLELLIATVLRIKKHTNKDLDFEGILYTRVDARLKLFKYMSQSIDEAYGKHIKIFKQYIPQSAEVGNYLYEEGRSIMFSNQKNPAVEAYEAVAKEMTQTMNFLPSGKEVKEEA